MIRLKHLLIATSIISTSVTADDFANVTGWVDLPIGSIHDVSDVAVEGKTHDINNVNPGIGITFAVKDVSEGDINPNMSYRIGAYRNSYENTSFYTGLNPHTNRNDNIMYGVVLGITTGYDIEKQSSGIIPILVPHVSFQGKYARAELSYIHGKYAKAIALTVGIPFNF